MLAASSSIRMRFRHAFSLRGRISQCGNCLMRSESSAELKTIDPDDPQAYQALALFYLSTGQKEKAVAEFKSLAAAKPKDNSVKVYLVETLVDLNRIQEAAAADEDLLKLTPADSRGLVTRGRILISQGKFQEAAAELDKAAKADPNLQMPTTS